MASATQAAIPQFLLDEDNDSAFQIHGQAARQIRSFAGDAGDAGDAGTGGNYLATDNAGMRCILGPDSGNALMRSGEFSSLRSTITAWEAKRSQ